MKKVLIAITTLSGGGAERVACVWATELVGQGYDVSLLVYGRVENEYPMSDKVKIYTVAESYAKYKELGYVERLKRMRKIVKEVNPDAVINFLPRMQIWMMMATFGRKLRRIETVRISPWYVYRNGSKEKILWHMCFNRANAIIVQTAEQAEYFKKKNRKKCAVIPNPLAKHYKEACKTEYKKVTEFVAAGRIAEQKNYPLMIEAFSLVAQKYEDICLFIYGAGDEQYTQKMQALIDEKGMSERIFLKGRTTELQKAYLESDAYLMSSDSEGMPNALMEAMATGLPCVSTDCRTGPKDLIEDGVNGYLAKTGDMEDFACQIEKVLAMNEDACKEMGRKAREKILELSSEENSLQVLIKTIEGA